MKRSLIVLVLCLGNVTYAQAQQATPPPTACQVQLNVVSQGRSFAESQLGELVVQLNAAKAELDKLKSSTKTEPTK